MRSDRSDVELLHHDVDLSTTMSNSPPRCRTLHHGGHGGHGGALCTNTKTLCPPCPPWWRAWDVGDALFTFSGRHSRSPPCGSPVRRELATVARAVGQRAER